MNNPKNKKRKKKKKAMPVFYRVLLAVFIIGLGIDAVSLLLLYGTLGRYEEQVMAAKEAEEAVAEVVSLPGASVANVPATSDTEPGDAASSDATSSDAASSDATEPADTLDGSASTSETSLSEDEAQAANEAAESGPSFEITPEETALVTATATDFTKAYAVYSLKKNAPGGEALSYVSHDSDLYGRLKSYNNDWGVTYSSDSFDSLTVDKVKKISEDPVQYSCVVDCTYSVSTGSGGNSYDLDFEYTLVPDESGAKMKIFEMQNR